MIEAKIDNGEIKKIACAGTPDILITDMVTMITIILKNVGNDEVKKMMFEILGKTWTDKNIPVYEELFPEENESRNKTEAFIKSIFRGK